MREYSLAPSDLAAIGATDWKPPPELQPEVFKFLVHLSDTAQRNFAEVRDYPYPMSRITLHVDFDAEKQKFIVRKVDGARNRASFEAVQISVRDTFQTIAISPNPRPLIAKVQVFTFIFR